MKLEFVLKSAYGKDRYYPANSPARAVVDLTGRKCLKLSELELLQVAGFNINIGGT